MNGLVHVAVNLLLVVAIIMLVLGASIVIKPQLYSKLATYFRKPGAIYYVAFIRIVIAVAMWLAAPVSGCPVILKGLAVFVLAAGVFVLSVGSERINRIIDWALGLPPIVLRLFGLLAVFFAGFLVWALSGQTVLG